VADLRVHAGRVTGLVTAGVVFEAPAVVLTTGTFLAGKIHVGFERTERRTCRTSIAATGGASARSDAASGAPEDGHAAALTRGALISP
jgi:tRNA U34 5-carboxymethylaminomethyl modifying enzyme MnmG/GidA